MQLVIIDYGMGNLHSITSAFKHIGIDPIVTDDHQKILSAERLLLPGVGSFALGMKEIKKRNLDSVIKEYSKNSDKRILGICLGMQLLTASSTENGFNDGLGLLDYKVEAFNFESLKVPHVGFNSVKAPKDSLLFKDINEDSDFYFTHSYRVPFTDNGLVGICNYGEDFIASFEKDNVFGTQFHPEKSQGNGLNLLKNFLG